MRKILGLSLLVLCLNPLLVMAEIDDPCAGDNPMLALLDRPTVSDSACVVPKGDVIVEIGYQHQILTGHGRGELYPEAELRFGLPFSTELALVLPTYVKQDFAQGMQGLSSAQMAMKYEVGYTEKWLGSVELLVTTPGSDQFGNDSYGATLNALGSYNINCALGLSFSLGISSLTDSTNTGGSRYTTVNPDVVFTYQPLDAWQLYVELYAQTKASGHDSFGMNTDFGVQYLLADAVEFDIEMGQHISGNLGGYQRYYGLGFGVWFM